MLLRIPWILVLLHIAHSEHVRYDNYSLYKIETKNKAEIKLLHNLEGGNGIEFWVEPNGVGISVRALVTPEKKESFEETLKTNNIGAHVALENIQQNIDGESINRYTKGRIRSMTWDGYYSLEHINQWLDDLTTANPNIVTPIVGGETYEGREIRGIKISYGPGRKIIFLEGGMHSREWISPATVNYITNELLYSSDPEIRSAAEGFDWYIFSVTNPDGYVWSFESDRMWRKNRRPIGNDFGVDLNRNWNSNWFVSGASSNPASNTYAGNGPFSEVETRTLSSFIRSIGDKIDLYLSFHSFSQLLLVPFGNTTDALGNYWDAVTIGRRAMGSLTVRYNTQYNVGNVAEAIYPATGGSIDWVKEHVNVPLVYCYELRDRGEYGFLLPTDQILPTCEETMDSILALIREAKFIGYMN